MWCCPSTWQNQILLRWQQIMHCAAANESVICMHNHHDRNYLAMILTTRRLPDESHPLPSPIMTNSPHINRRLRSSTAHNLSKPAQMRRSRAQSWRISQRSTSCRCSCKTSRRIPCSRVARQAESPSCAIAQAGLLRVLEPRCLARCGAGGLLLGLLGGVGGHIVH